MSELKIFLIGSFGVLTSRTHELVQTVLPEQNLDGWLPGKIVYAGSCSHVAVQC